MLAPINTTVAYLFITRYKHLALDVFVWKMNRTPCGNSTPMYGEVVRCKPSAGL